MDDIAKIRIAYDIAKAARRDPATGKQYTDRDFAQAYLDSNFSMVTKILTGKAVSKPTLDAICRFIADSEPQIKEAAKTIEVITSDFGGR